VQPVLKGTQNPENFAVCGDSVDPIEPRASLQKDDDLPPDALDSGVIDERAWSISLAAYLCRNSSGTMQMEAFHVRASLSRPHWSG